MNISLLKNRWQHNELLNTAKYLVLDKSFLPEGMSQKQWYQSKALKVDSLYWGDNLDLNGANFSNLIIENADPTYCSLKHADFSNSSIKNTSFSHSDIEFANFSGCVLSSVQMLPIFANNCDFSDAQISNSFIHGFEPVKKGYCSELKRTNFTRCISSDTYFDFCDFDSANFTNAVFKNCIFKNSDFRNVNFTGCQFIDCDFREAVVDDAEVVIKFLQNGGNKNLSSVVVVVVSTPANPHAH
jgi:uncharacterized protein YjbI with pentapeptide repeats